MNPFKVLTPVALGAGFLAPYIGAEINVEYMVVQLSFYALAWWWHSVEED